MMLSGKKTFEGKIKIVYGHPSRGIMLIHDKDICDMAIEYFETHGTEISKLHENIHETKSKYRITIERID